MNPSQKSSVKTHPCERMRFGCGSRAPSSRGANGTNVHSKGPSPSRSPSLPNPTIWMAARRFHSPCGAGRPASRRWPGSGPYVDPAGCHDPADRLGRARPRAKRLCCCVRTGKDACSLRGTVARAHGTARTGRASRAKDSRKWQPIPPSRNRIVLQWCHWPVFRFACSRCAADHSTAQGHLSSGSTQYALALSPPGSGAAP